VNQKLTKSSRLPSLPPRWAEMFGEDRRGVCASFECKGVKFFWRWIPPGRFLMGSPEGEVGHFEDEHNGSMLVGQGVRGRIVMARIARSLGGRILRWKCWGGTMEIVEMVHER